MPNVEKITKQTENPFVNLYLVEGTNKVNHHFRYYVASRAKSIEQMKIKTRKNTPDGVLMYSLYGENATKLSWCASTAFPLMTTSTNSRQAWWNRARSSMRLPCARCMRRPVLRFTR